MNQLLEKALDTIISRFNTSRELAIAYLIVSALVVIMALVAAAISVLVWIRYARANRMGIKNQMNGMDTCRYALDRAELPYVKVKSGFLVEFLFGNYYNIYTKTVYLRKLFGKIDKTRSVTSTALALQKAAVAKLCESGDKKAVIRNRFSILAIFGPLLFIPFVLIGFLLDFYVFKTHSGQFYSFLGLGAGGLLLLIGLVVTFLNIPVEKKANQMALEMARDFDLATEEEIQVMEKVFQAYILQYICNFILEVLRVIQFVLEIVMSSNNKKD